MIFFFFKQKTAYEMRISDWSSDVCSSDLHRLNGGPKLWVLVALFLHHPYRANADFRGKLGSLVHGSLFSRAGASSSPGAVHRKQIGRASCRERVCQYV